MPAVFPLEHYLNIRSATGATFSPDGRYVAFLTAITGVSQVWQVPVGGGWPEQLTFHRDSVRLAAFSPTRPVLLYAMDSGGDERTQLYLLRGVAGNTDHGFGDGWLSTHLTREPKAVHQFGGWSRDGRFIAFSANRESASRFDVYVLDVDKPKAEPRLVAKGPGGYYQPVGFSPDGMHLLIRRAESNFHHELDLVRLKDGHVRRLTTLPGDVQYESPRWSADGLAVFCASTAENRDKPGLARIDVANGKLSYLATPDHEVEAVAVSPKGRWLAYLVNVDGRSELHWHDLTGRAKPQFAAPALGLIHAVEFAPDGERVAFTFEGPRHNPDLWLADIGEAGPVKARPLTHSSRAGLPLSQFVEPELIHYPSFDGLKIPAWYFAPQGAGERTPVIVYPHGGPESQTRPGFTALFQYFLSRGYAVLAPNVRGSSGYGTKYMNLDNVRKRMDSVKDLAHAAYWLRDQKKGDPKRLAVYGGSYGGFMVLSALTEYPDLWAAGIDIVGICNFVTFLEKTGAYRRAHREKEYGSLQDDREFLTNISPLHKADKIKAPLMVIHGANDPRVPIDEAEQIVAALKKRGVPVEYLRYEDEGHGLAKLKNRLDAYPKMVAFLDKHLKSEKPSGER